MGEWDQKYLRLITKLMLNSVVVIMCFEIFYY